jgi:hypothetical protein
VSPVTCFGYEVMGWGAGQFLSDWDEIIKVQNRSTLDGSPVAQAIIKFMEDRESFEGSSTELHRKLESIAEQIGVSIVRDKAWPKSARWLWRRIQEVVPLLVGVGIEASREHTGKGTQVALRKVPRNDVSNVREGGSGKGKAILADNSAGVMSGSNVRSDSNVRSNVRSNVSANPAKTKGSDNTDNTDIRYGDFSEMSSEVADDDGRQPETDVWENDPMRRYGKGA